MAKSIFSRKRDALYLLYFAVHLPIMFLVDLAPLYPAAYLPTISKKLLEYQVATYQDQFFVVDVPFFAFYRWLELFFHVPVALWAIGGLINDNPKLPIVLLVYAMETVMTTATCMYDYVFWTTVSYDVKVGLTTLYGPYLALSVLMALDMCIRLNSVVNTAIAAKSVKKTS